MEEFAALFKGRKLAIKAALLNQSLLHGVGNIYADESLFRAGIRPTRQAGRLTKVELKTVAGGAAGSVAAGDQAGWIIGVGLCGCRGNERVFPDRAQGVWAGWRGLHGVRRADQKDRGGWAGDALLCGVPEVAVIGVAMAGRDNQRRRVQHGLRRGRE